VSGRTSLALIAVAIFIAGGVFMALLLWLWSATF
jgi:hypothetical protein